MRSSWRSIDRKEGKETLERELPKTVIDSEKLKYCFECGICTASCPVAELLPKHYNPRSLLHRAHLDINRVLTEDELWLCAWCYRCFERCPQGLKLPEIFLSIRRFAVERGYKQGFRKALKKIRKEIPLPATLCWVCFHPERAKVDRQTITSALEQLNEKEEKLPITKTLKEKIAIIGSGPAGLTAAYELVNKGYSVTIFETLPKPGGMLRRCIPEYRLPKSALDADIERIKSRGVEIRTNTTIGKDLQIDELLREGYKAIFIATGAHRCRKLRIQGEELKGVIHALDFLEEVNLGKRVKLGDRVVVIGGGNVAIDAARTASRLGAEVTILYRRSREEMPANPWEVKEAEEEGVNIRFLAAPKRILGDGQKVMAIECIQMQLGKPDESGRRAPIPIEGSEFTLKTDTIIVAIGETPDLFFLPEDVVAERNLIAVDPISMETSFPSIFSGGDVTSGPATVIEAIVAGKRAAASIDHYLKNRIEISQKIKRGK